MIVPFGRTNDLKSIGENFIVFGLIFLKLWRFEVHESTHESTHGTVSWLARKNSPWHASFLAWHDLWVDSWVDPQGMSRLMSRPLLFWAKKIQKPNLWTLQQRSTHESTPEAWVDSWVDPYDGKCQQRLFFLPILIAIYAF